ncbi:MAG: PAS domain-containing protein, partial [Acetobacteraceae bacterium]|nr:PAS domain-containing protein [Acetobacteraceae bacterium]
MNQLVTILAPRGRDAAVIAQVLERAGIKSQTCPALDALPPLLDGSSAVMVTEEALRGEGLHPVLRWVERQPPWSDLAFIVLAAKHIQGRSREHRDMLEGLGNSQLLERPLNAESLASAARAALRARRRQLAMRDLTDTLEMRVAQRTEALAESEERFRATFEGFPECLFVFELTPDGRFLFESCNPAAERRTGLTTAETRGRVADLFMPAEQAALVHDSLARCVASGTSLSFNEELDFPAGRGTFETTLTPMHGA